MPGSDGVAQTAAAEVLDAVQVQLVAARGLVDSLRDVPNLPRHAAGVAEESIAVLAAAQDLIVPTFHQGEVERADLAPGRDGLSNAQLSVHLGISENTVKKHVKSVLRKLGVGQREDIPPIQG